MEFIFSNAARGKLEGSIGTGDGTLTLKAGQGVYFPTPSTGQGFHLVVSQGGKYEWMICTAKSSDIFTVSRGTPAQSFSDGATVELRLHKDALGNMLQKGSFRSVAADPDGSLAALYPGEEVYQTGTGVWWKHCTSTIWKEMNL